MKDKTIYEVNKEIEKEIENHKNDARLDIIGRVDRFLDESYYHGTLSQIDHQDKIGSNEVVEELWEFLGDIMNEYKIKLPVKQ